MLKEHYINQAGIRYHAPIKTCTGIYSSLLTSLRKTCNKIIDSELEAWLSFLWYMMVEKIIELIETYPKFKAMYEEIYNMCYNIEKVMQMYSKSWQVDRNTVQYMIEEQEKLINEQAEQINEQAEQINEQAEQINEQAEQINEQAEQINEQAKQIAELRKGWRIYLWPILI